LLNFALRLNAEAAEPMNTQEVAKTVASVWRYTKRGDDTIGMHGGVYMQRHEIDDLTSDAFRLLAFLRAHQGKRAHQGRAPYFWIANALANRFDWTVKRLAAAPLGSA
jgi:hypothetical protein